jgi:hypothetical protein
MADPKFTGAAANKKVEATGSVAGMERIVESKGAKFRRLANARVNRAVKYVGHVANLSNTSTYSYTEEQAEKVVAAMEAAMADLRRRFSGHRSQYNGFQL